MLLQVSIFLVTAISILMPSHGPLCTNGYRSIADSYTWLAADLGFLAQAVPETVHDSLRPRVIWITTHIY